MIKRTISDRGECWSIFQFPEDKIICQECKLFLQNRKEHNNSRPYIVENCQCEFKGHFELYCSICLKTGNKIKASYNVFNGATSTMKRHLDLHKNATIINSLKDNKSEKTVKEKKLDNMFTPIDKDHVHELLLKVIISQDLSYSVVNNVYLHELLTYLNPNVQIQSDTQLKTKYLDNIYMETVNTLKEKIQLIIPGCISITTDIGSKAGNAFNCVTIHGPTNDLELISFVLDISPFNQQHKSEDIRNEILNVCYKYGIGKIHSIISDAATNNNKLKEICNIKYNCIIHIANRLVSDLLKKYKIIKDLLISNNKIAKTLKISCQEQQKLRSIFKQMGEKFHAFPTYSPTRFNSSYYQLSYIVKYEKILTQYVHNITDNISLIKEILPFFNYINEIYRELSIQSHPTFQSIYPVVKGLGICLETLKNGEKIDINCNLSSKELKQIDKEENVISFDTDEKYIDGLISSIDINDEHPLSPNEKIVYLGKTDLWDYLLTRFHTRFDAILENKNVQMAAYLHPNSRLYLSDTHMNDCRKMFEDCVHLKMKEIVEKPKEKQKIPLYQLYSSITTNSQLNQQTQNPKDEMLSIVCRKFEEMKFKENETYCEFMKRTADEFEGLYKLFSENIFIPTSSIPSERVFSSLNCLLTKFRLNMNNDRTCKMLLIKSFIKQKKIVRKEYYSTKDKVKQEKKPKHT